MSQTFSPHKSPVPQVEQQQSGRNLTGSVRKLKDTAADIHNLLSKWSSLNNQGLPIISDISNIKLQVLFKQDSNEEELNVPLLPLTLEPKCEALLLVTESMEKIVKKLEAFTASVRGIQALMKNQDDVLFKGWSIQHFVDNFDALHKMYDKELRLKQKIAQNVAHADSRDMLMFYSTAWLHQPYVDSALLIEMLLLETGHH